MATPSASDTPLQPEAAMTTPAAPKEMTMVTPDVAGSSSGQLSWENHVSHFCSFDMARLLTCFADAYVSYGISAFWPCLDRIRQGLFLDGAGEEYTPSHP